MNQIEPGSIQRRFLSESDRARFDSKEVSFHPANYK